MAIAKVHWKKRIVRGERKFEITKTEGFLDAAELPAAYLAKPPRMVLGNEGQVEVHLPENVETVGNLRLYGTPREVRFYIRRGVIMSEDGMEQALKWMRICGSRLTGINKSLAKRNADWHGEGVEEI